MKDLYNRERTILSLKKKFKELCPNCFQTMERLEHTLKLNSYSLCRIERYWCSMRPVHEKLSKCFEKAELVDIENLIIGIDSNNKWAEWTKAGFKEIIKFFYRWLINDTVERGSEYPKLVKWIKTKIKKNNSKTPDQILTKEEIEQLAKSTDNLRNRAMVLTLYESGCRIGELLGMKIKDIQFDQFGCYIMVSGKTGWRRVRIIDYSKELLEWLDSHPFKINVESYVWISSEKPSPENILMPSSVNDILKELAKKYNITKPIHNHALRHARATHLSKHLPDAVMKQMFGWANDSKMASVYYHLSGKDVDEALLKLHGIKSEDIKEDKSGIKLCKKCGENNSILSHFCKKCNFPLDSKAILEQDERERQFDEFIKDFLVELSKRDPTVKKVFKQMVRERNVEHLFK